MSMIRTAKRENPFVQLDKFFIEDPKLSFEAKGILAYVLSKPDDWTIRKNDLVKRSASGKTRIETALLELMASGYLNWYQIRDNDGTFGDWVYDVYERPEFNPNADRVIQEGLKRMNDRKTKNKKKHADRVESEKSSNDNPPKAEFPSSAPKAGFPTSDNPKSDNPPYSNNELKDIDLSNREEEEDYIYIGESEIPQRSEGQNQKPSAAVENAPHPKNSGMEEIEAFSQRKAPSSKNYSTVSADDLIRQNPAYEYLSDYLLHQGIRSDYVSDVIVECERHGLQEVSAKDIQGQYKHMMGKVKNEDTIYDFTSYFVGGLQRRRDLRVASNVQEQQDKQEAAQRASRKVPLYNWLEDRN